MRPAGVLLKQRITLFCEHELNRRHFNGRGAFAAFLTDKDEMGWDRFFRFPNDPF
jgi:hypothetical protein